MPVTRTKLNLKQTTIYDHLTYSGNKMQSDEISRSTLSKMTGDSQQFSATHNDSTTNQPQDDLLNDEAEETKKNIMDTTNTWNHITHQPNSNETKVMKQTTERQYITLNLPTFNGSINQDSEEWLMKIKYILQQENIPADKCFNTIVYHLQGPAFKWFYRRQNEFNDLETFEEKFLEQYPVHNGNGQEGNQQVNNSVSYSNHKNVSVKSNEIEPKQQRQSIHKSLQSAQLNCSSSSEKLQPITNQVAVQSNEELDQNLNEIPNTSLIRPYQQVDKQENSLLEMATFSGEMNEDAGEWIDKMMTLIEQQKLTPIEKRDLTSKNLRGKALLWYRMNRLKIPDIQSFVQEFLLNYSQSQSSIPDISSTSNVILLQGVSPGATTTTLRRQERERSSNRSDSPRHVLQSAENEKVKLLSSFTGSENAVNWLNNLQQTGKSLKLNDQQIYELATLKLSGPAQEWYYYQHQNNEIDDWISFKEAFLHAFPSPIQPTNIDYLSQLVSRKQGETESVGKFAQDINRLCLKLDNKVSEQEKLQYLRKGLRPQLQHYALSITSIQDFLTTMQRHEQIEKEKTLNKSLSPQVSSSFRGTRPSNSYSTTSSNNHSNVRPSTALRNTESPQHQIWFLIVRIQIMMIPNKIIRQQHICQRIIINIKILTIMKHHFNKEIIIEYVIYVINLVMFKTIVQKHNHHHNNIFNNGGTRWWCLRQ